MEQAVQTRTDLDPQWYPKHILYLKSRIAESLEFEEQLRKETTAKDFPYYELYAAIEERCMWEDQLQFELKHWDGDPEAERHIPFAKDNL